MGIVDYNIRTVESVQKVRRIQRPAATGEADNYVATGDTLEQRWTGPWSELEQKMLSLDYSATSRLSATLTRTADGSLAELSATWSEYIKAPGAESAGSGADYQLPGSSREAPSYSLQVTCVQEPLLTHPKYENLEGKALTALKLLMDGTKESDVVSQDESGNPVTLQELLAEVGNQELVNKIRKGQTHYMAPQIAITARYKASRIPDTGNAFKISQPPGNFSTPAGCDWLQLVPGIEAHGKEIWVSETYLLSGPGGWDPDIYD